MSAASLEDMRLKNVASTVCALGLLAAAGLAAATGTGTGFATHDFDLARQIGRLRTASHRTDPDTRGEQLRYYLAADVSGGSRDQNVFHII